MRLIILVLLFSLQSCKFLSHEEMDLNVRKITLPNGLTCLLVKRGGPPVFSAYLRIKVGNIEETRGHSGLAHFFEHMAFKGTPTIGTKDYDAEKPILEKLAALGPKLNAARKNNGPVAQIQAEISGLQDEENRLIEQNEFVRILQSSGGEDLNATTSNDFTSYFVSLPTNRLELWAYLESERLLAPVFREFYKERDVVAEERRMRYDNSPDGRLYEAFMDTSFDTSPYKINVIGYPQDIQSYTFEAARAFREKYYIPSRMVVSLAGNFDLDEAENIVRKYFGPLPSKKDEPFEIATEPMTGFPREKILTGDDEPRFYMGFHRPAYPHPDDVIFDVLQQMLCDGRTSRLFSVLVEQKKLATDVDCNASLPATRLDGLFTIYAQPLAPHTNRELADAILGELDRLKKELVTDTEIQKMINRIDADLVWSLDSNMGLATMLTYFESVTGDWRYVYRVRDLIHQIKPQDIQRVVQTYFKPERRSTVYLEKGTK